jgi:hypothetical protein
LFFVHLREHLSGQHVCEQHDCPDLLWDSAVM